MNEEQRRNLRAYFSTLPNKDVQRAKGFVPSDKTKLNNKGFQQRKDEQTQRNAAAGSRSGAGLDLWQIVIWSVIFIAGFGFIKYISK